MRNKWALVSVFQSFPARPAPPIINYGFTIRQRGRNDSPEAGIVTLINSDTKICLVTWQLHFATNVLIF